VLGSKLAFSLTYIVAVYLPLEKEAIPSLAVGIAPGRARTSPAETLASSNRNMDRALDHLEPIVFLLWQKLQRAWHALQGPTTAQLVRDCLTEHSFCAHEQVLKGLVLKGLV
jgi:hypothetical protein